VKKYLTVLLILALTAALTFSALAGPAEDRVGSLNAKAAIAVDMENGEVLYASEADLPLAPASTTKILTSLLVLEAIDEGRLTLQTAVTVTNEMIDAIPYDASRMTEPMVAGEILTIEQLLYANLIESDCMASYVLAIALSGSTEAFCSAMNSRVDDLLAAEGLEALPAESSNFTNPSGYPDKLMVTTVRVMSLISLQAMKNETFRTIVSTPHYTMAATNKCSERKLTNTNLFLPERLTDPSDSTGTVENSLYNPYVFGVKTGSSEDSGYCLVSAIRQGDRSLLIVLFGAHGEDSTDFSVAFPQYPETLRIADTLDYLAQALQAMEDTLTARSAAVDSASEAYQTALSHIHERDAAVQQLADETAAKKEEAGSRIVYSAEAGVLLLLLGIAAAVIRRRK